MKDRSYGDASAKVRRLTRRSSASPSPKIERRPPNQRQRIGQIEAAERPIRLLKKRNPTETDFPERTARTLKKRNPTETDFPERTAARLFKKLNDKSTEKRTIGKRFVERNAEFGLPEDETERGFQPRKAPAPQPTPSALRRKERERQKRESLLNLRRKHAAGPHPDRPFDERELLYRDPAPFRERTKPSAKNKNQSAPLEGKIRLNRYIALSGRCARREADRLIEAGKVSVNGQIVKTLGTKVDVRTDKVEIGGKLIKPEKPVYILLNKPKNCLTTLRDPEGRPTIMDWVQPPGGERIFPVGRLDRNTTGVLLLTNDGELAKKL
ncbi:MAG: pseudouridine synthase, partial [Bacteroidia bacterium]|nr:pseudouridine synthase [Bacteroidia bacterium]